MLHSMLDWIRWVAAAAFAAALATAHLAFALGNFGLAREERAAVSVPLAEGVLSLVAAVALGVAAVSLVRRQLLRAGIVAFAGTFPLPIFFAFTVPKYSDPLFFFASLVVPVAAGVTAAAAAIVDERR